MEIYAKASLDAGEIREKIRCGCDGIEFNLESDFFEKGGCFKSHYAQELFTMHPAGVVHYPFLADRQMMNMEHIFQQEDLSPVYNVFCMAQYLADIWGRRVLVVLHSSLSFFDFMGYGLFRRHLERELAQLLEKFPMADLAIENVVPMEYREKLGESPRLCNGTFTDIPKIVGYLRERFGNRVGSVLDTCHAAMTEKYMKALLIEADFWPKGAAPQKLDYSMEHYFKANKGICKLIHFNDFTGNGYLKNHGAGFTDQKKVDALLDLYRKYGYSCPLTLEIREENYGDCKNYRKTKAMVGRYLQGVE